MATPTAASTTIRPAASTTAPAAIDVFSSQSPASLALRPQASPSAPQVTPPAPTVPMNMPAPISESPPLIAMAPSSTLDIDGSSPRTDLNTSLEGSLDPAQWLNAGTPEVFYRRAHVEPPNRTARMIHQFTEGMNAFGKLWDLVKGNWIAFLPLFTNMQEPLSKAAFKAIFTYSYSSRGTNRREEEEDTIYCWELVLNMIEDKLTELRFEDLLIFITGADEVPALGFPNKPCIDFFEQESGQRRLPYASTCMMCLFLPRGITQEDELHQMLLQATKDSLGVGKV